MLVAGTPNGVVVSTNGGSSWSALSFQGHDVTNVAMSGTSAYAVHDGGLSVSTDGGTTWSNALPASWSQTYANDVTAVAVVGSKIYVALTFGVSISP